MQDDNSTFFSTDTATEKDELGFTPYVKAIAEFLTHPKTLAPITLSIEGQWGCGKSSFMRQLQKEIIEQNRAKGKTNYFTVWFNSWKYEKEEELWASFALSFMDELSKQLSWKRLQYSRLKLFYLRYKLLLKSDFLVFVHFSWSILSFIIIFSFMSLFITYVLHSLGMPLPNIINDEFFKNFSNLVLISAPLVGLMTYLSAEKWFIDVFRDPFSLKKVESNTNYKERLSFREHFHSDLNEIINSYVGDSKVYVFIDDLDRCEVPKAAELMQAINLMISDNSKVYFSLAMDRKIISAGITAKNKKVIKYLGIEGLEYGYDFIEKFIQLPFKVPSPKTEDFLKYLTSSDEKEPSKTEPIDKQNKPEVSPSDNLSEGDLKSSQNESKGQETGSDDSNNVETESNKQEILNDKDCVEEKLILEMVAPALDNNPRRIKLFMNQFRFQKTIGYRTSLFSYDKTPDLKKTWNCKKLAKFVAISIKWPSLISDLSLNLMILKDLQTFALTGVVNPKNEKILNKWINENRLIELLKKGCEEDEAGYTFEHLDFSKLLEISPEVMSSDSLSDGNEIEFVLIPPGKFMMGSSNKDETPAHEVTIIKPFDLGKYPVTQKQWIAVMGSNPSYFKGDDLPVENVMWDDVQKYVTKLNEKEHTDKYRLPSESEWEYACRAGEQTSYSFGNDKSKINEYCWYDKNSDRKTQPVGKKMPNNWGLYDMHGNVWEWVQDDWHENYYGAPSDGSAWEDGDNFYRVCRGGSSLEGAAKCRSASRFRHHPTPTKSNDLGFRLLKKL